MVFPMALTTTHTRCPSRFAATTRSATRPTRSRSATDDPPYFCTMMLMAMRPVFSPAARRRKLPGVRATAALLAALAAAPSARADPASDAATALAVYDAHGRFAEALAGSGWRRDDPRVRAAADEATGVALPALEEAGALRDEARELAREAAGAPLGHWLRRPENARDGLLAAWLREHPDADLEATAHRRAPHERVVIALAVAARRPALAASLLRTVLRGDDHHHAEACAAAMALPAPLRREFAASATAREHRLRSPHCLALYASLPAQRAALAREAAATLARRSDGEGVEEHEVGGAQREPGVVDALAPHAAGVAGQHRVGEPAQVADGHRRDGVAEHPDVVEGDGASAAAEQLARDGGVGEVLRGGDLVGVADARALADVLPGPEQRGGEGGEAPRAGAVEQRAHAALEHDREARQRREQEARAEHPVAALEHHGEGVQGDEAQQPAIGAAHRAQARGGHGEEPPGGAQPDAEVAQPGRAVGALGAQGVGQKAVEVPVLP